MWKQFVINIYVLLIYVLLFPPDKIFDSFRPFFDIFSKASHTSKHIAGRGYLRDANSLQHIPTLQPPLEQPRDSFKIQIKVEELDMTV